MLGYGVFASCACAVGRALSSTTIAKLPSAIVVTIFRFIVFLLDAEIEVPRRANRPKAVLPILDSIHISLVKCK
jgi:hypothetical protein